MEILNQFRARYTKKTKHRKRCPACNKLIQDGQWVLMQQIRTERYHPVKGLKWYVRWQFTHTDCVED